MPILPKPPANLFGRILAFVLSAALIVAGVMFSLIFLAVATVVGILFAGWFWWKTRTLRRNMETFKENLQAATQDAAGQTRTGATIEGEFQRETGSQAGYQAGSENQTEHSPPEQHRP